MIPTELWEVLHGPFGCVSAFLFGTLFGSFANVCIYRWPPTEENPRGRSVIKPGSHCFGCGSAIRFFDNIPIVSYFTLGGRCRVCKLEFSPRYLFVEIATGMLFAGVYYLAVILLPDAGAAPDRLLRFAIYAAFVFVLVVIFFIDLDHKLVLDKITYPAIPIFYGLGMLLPERHWSDGLIGAAVGYGVVRGIADGYYHLTGREGLGYGDGKLLALVGALLGWKAVVASLFMGSLLGTLVSVPVLLWQRARTPAPALHAPLPPPELSVPGPEALPGGAVITEADTIIEATLPEPPSIGRVEIPFAPFLVGGALAYLFLEQWLRINALGL